MLNTKHLLDYHSFFYTLLTVSHCAVQLLSELNNITVGASKSHSPLLRHLYHLHLRCPLPSAASMDPQGCLPFIWWYVILFSKFTRAC